MYFPTILLMISLFHFLKRKHVHWYREKVIIFQIVVSRGTHRGTWGGRRGGQVSLRASLILFYLFYYPLLYTMYLLASGIVRSQDFNLHFRPFCSSQNRIFRLQFECIEIAHQAEKIISGVFLTDTLTPLVACHTRSCTRKPLLRNGNFKFKFK